MQELGEIDPAEAETRIDALQKGVCDPGNEKLAELASNPLLLTVIAHLHSSQQDLKLPDNRAQLFHDLIDLLLTRWAERHQRRTGAAVEPAAAETLGELLLDPGVKGFEREHLLQLIAELAHDHFRGGQDQTLILIPEATLRRRLEEVEELCEAAEGKDDVTALEWRRVALAGDILDETGPERLGREPRQSASARNLVRGRLARLLGQGALQPRVRARASIVLGHLSDPRPGVGLQSDGLPDLDWIEIPAGRFLMGSKAGETSWPDDTPQFDRHLIRQPYRISRYPVTVAQYQAFVDAGGYGESARPFWTEAGWSWKRAGKVTGPKDYNPEFQTHNHPRVGVCWYEAVAYCRWLSVQLRSKGHLPLQDVITLPSEAQWKRAACHTDGRAYPWGPKSGDLAQRCNMAGTGLGHTCAVGMFPRDLPSVRRPTCLETCGNGAEPNGGATTRATS